MTTSELRPGSWTSGYIRYDTLSRVAYVISMRLRSSFVTICGWFEFLTSGRPYRDTDECVEFTDFVVQQIPQILSTIKMWWWFMVSLLLKDRQTSHWQSHSQATSLLTIHHLQAWYSSKRTRERTFVMVNLEWSHLTLLSLLLKQWACHWCYEADVLPKIKERSMD